MACKLVYWGKATFIHTLCDNSQFILSPYVSNHYSTALKDKFAEKFPVTALISPYFVTFIFKFHIFL